MTNKMVVVDVNVLLYAFDVGSPSHAKSVEWLERAGDSDELMGISSQVLASVLRIATNPSLVNRPTSAQLVLEFLEDVRNLPAFVAAEPGAGHWSLFARFVVQHQLQKGSLTDGWLAALAIELGASLVTTDAGFTRFRGLQIVNPLHAG